MGPIQSDIDEIIVIKNENDQLTRQPSTSQIGIPPPHYTVNINDSAEECSSDETSSPSSAVCTVCGTHFYHESLKPSQGGGHSPQNGCHSSASGGLMLSNGISGSTTPSSGEHVCSQCASLTQSPEENKSILSKTINNNKYPGSPRLNKVATENGVSKSTGDIKLELTSDQRALMKRRSIFQSDSQMEQFLSMSEVYGVGLDVTMCDTPNSNPKILINGRENLKQNMATGPYMDYLTLKCKGDKTGNWII